MIILGSERVVTQDYIHHKHAEDYAGAHLSLIKLYGKAKVVKVVNKYKSHEDSINYNEFIDNQKKWRDGNYYNCISVTGKVVRYEQSELGGNEIQLESYINKKKYHFRLLHLAEINVQVGDIIDSNTIVGRQGNTGLVLSNKPNTDITYGSHIHFEVTDQDYNNVNPRNYAIGAIHTDYIEQTNNVDNTKDQIKIIVDKINIRESSNITFKDIGNVYNGEIYDVLDIVEDDKYIWYRIQTNLGISGYVANEKGKKWVEFHAKNTPIEAPIPVDEVKDIKLIYTCLKDGTYAIQLKEGEKLYIQ